MSDDFLSLQMMVVSEAAAERAMVAREAALVSMPIEVVEVDGKDDGAAACARLAQGGLDVVLCDSRISKAGRQALLDAARAAKAGPLAILIGASSLKTREVLTDGLAVDGVLAKPLDQQELRRLIESCVRARLSNRVLIVDDSSTVRSVVRKVLLASRGFRLNLDEAEDGAKAIALVGQQRYDVVFLDCHMPGLDGFATLSEIRKTRPETRVVMITGTRDIRIEDRARADGASDFLYKPFFAHEIDALLSRQFGLMRPRWN
jgi:CheY-like chemotaxis protein